MVAQGIYDECLAQPIPIFDEDGENLTTFGVAWDKVPESTRDDFRAMAKAAIAVYLERKIRVY
jgi:hypothetical protein